MKYLFGIAMLPAIVLMVYIYKKDKKEKEPFRKLLLCFVWGCVSIIPAIVIELILTGVLAESVLSTVTYLLIENYLVIALTEELCKYFFLNAVSKKNTYFDHFFDGIVYSVFVSMGFAATENVMYVLQNGLGVGLLRMVTAVPGHMCFAVFMGFYYSRKLYCVRIGEKRKAKHFARWAILGPVFIHGTYDFLATYQSVPSIIAWIIGIIILFIFSFKFVKRASENDMSFFKPEFQEAEAV